MDLDEFKRTFEYGMGRALLFLKDNPATPAHREIILEACLRDTTFDHQIEPSRLPYLLEAIRLHGDEDFFKQRILASDPVSEQVDAWLALGFAMHFAMQDDPQARRMLYDYFDRPHAQFLQGAAGLISLDGIDGLVHVAQNIGQRVLNSETDPDQKLPRFQFLERDHKAFLSLLKSRGIDEDAAHAALVEKETSNPALSAYLKQVEDSAQFLSTSKTTRPRPAPQQLTYEQIVATLNAREWHNSHFQMHHWAKEANEEEFLQAASDMAGLNPETDSTKVLAYLRAFAERAYPLDVNHLLRLATFDLPASNATPSNEPVGINFYAMRALRLISHPSVRKLALDLIAKGQQTGSATELLNRNWQRADWQLIESLTANERDTMEFHNIGNALRHLLEHEHTPEEISGILLNVYEYGRCSYCRTWAVQRLSALGAMPEWLVTEYQYDVVTLAEREYMTDNSKHE